MIRTLILGLALLQASAGFTKAAQDDKKEARKAHGRCLRTRHADRRNR